MNWIKLFLIITLFCNSNLNKVEQIVKGDIYYCYNSQSCATNFYVDLTKYTSSQKNLIFHIQMYSTNQDFFENSVLYHKLSYDYNAAPTDTAAKITSYTSGNQKIYDFVVEQYIGIYNYFIFTANFNSFTSRIYITLTDIEVSNKLLPDSFWDDLWGVAKIILIVFAVFVGLGIITFLLSCCCCPPSANPPAKKCYLVMEV